MLNVLEERLNRRLFVEFTVSDDCQLRQDSDDLWVGDFVVQDTRGNKIHRFEVFFYLEMMNFEDKTDRRIKKFEVWKIKFGPKSIMGNPTGNMRDLAWLMHLGWNKLVQLPYIKPVSDFLGLGAEVSGGEIFSKIACTIKKFLLTRKPDSIGFTALYPKIEKVFDTLMNADKTKRILGEAGYRVERVRTRWGHAWVASRTDLNITMQF